MVNIDLAPVILFELELLLEPGILCTKELLLGPVTGLDTDLCGVVKRGILNNKITNCSHMVDDYIITIKTTFDYLQAFFKLQVYK